MILKKAIKTGKEPYVNTLNGTSVNRAKQENIFMID